MRTCATSVERNSRVTMSLLPPGESDLWKNLCFCLTGWERACLQREKSLSEWRWWWKMEKWTLWRTGSNTHHITGQETLGKTLYFAHVAWFLFIIVMPFFSYVLCTGAYTQRMITHTVFVTPLRTSHTHCAPKSFSPGMSLNINALFIRYWHRFYFDSNSKDLDFYLIPFSILFSTDSCGYGSETVRQVFLRKKSFN